MGLGLSINKGLFAGVLLALLIFSGMWWYSYRQTKEANKTAALIAHSDEILYQSTRILATMTDNETGARGFVLTGKPEFLEPFEHSKKSIHYQVAALQVMEKDNRGVLNIIDTLLLYIDKRITFSDSMVAVRQVRGLAEAASLVSGGTEKFYLDQIRGLIKRIQTDKNGSLEKQMLAITAELKIEKITFFALAFIMLGLMIIVFVKEKVRVQQRERDKAQLSLAALSMQINESNNAIYTLDAQRKIISWNRGAQHLYGYSAEEAIGKNSNQLLQTKTQPSELNTSIIELTRDNYWMGELERITKTGKIVFVNSSTTTIKNIKGLVTGYVVIGIDITAQKKLSRQVNYLASLVEQSTEAIFSRNAEQHLTSWNRGAERLFGYTKEEAIGKTISELGILHLSQQYIDKVQEQITTAGSWESENTYFRKGGSSFVGSVTGNVIKTEKEEDNSFYFIVKDITVSKQLQQKLEQYSQELEKKVVARTEKIIQNEKRFRALIENNNDVISLMDASFKIFYRSPSAQRIMGWSDEEMLESHGAVNIHPHDQLLAATAIKEVMAKPGKRIETIFRKRHKDGHYIWMEGSIINMLDVAGVNAIVYNYRDISRRKELEDLLHRANKLAQIGGWEIDLVKETVYWTNITREIHETAMDYTPDLETGISFYKHGESRDLINKKVKEAIENGQSWDVELPIITAKNNERWIRSIGEAEIVNGKCIRVYGSFQNIDERKKAQLKLIESEQRFKALVENNYDIITLIDESFNIIYQSPSVSRVTGFSREEIQVLEGGENIHPADREYAQKVFQQAAASPGMPVKARFRTQHREGQYIWLEGMVTNLLQDEYIRAFVTNFRDITDRKEAEEKLKSSEEHYKMLVEQAVDGIFLSDANGKYVEVNTAGCNLLGYTKEELTNKTIADIIDEDEIPRLPAEVQRFANGAISVSEWKFKQKDGSAFIGEVIGRSLPDGRLQGILRDITERREAEKKIQNLNASLEEKILLRTQELRKSNEELEAFSYSVSHDLRAPLRAIVGYASILEEDYGNKLDDEARRITGVIKKNTLKMGNLIDDLLTFSRTGKHELVKTLINTGRLISEITTEIDNTNNHIDHKITWQISELPFVQADLSALRQVWVNLISNAVKYSCKIKDPLIEIGSFKQNNQITFFVKDNGAGFDEKYKNKLFKVFQRLHGTKEFEGTGIGLAVVDKIISKHGGTVWAEGAVNKGACFYFSLPQNE